MFDSGLGSLSVIREIQRQTRCDIVYFADRKSFPYGGKTKRQLERIVGGTVEMLRDRFDPDLIVVGSNTPSILLDVEAMWVEGGRSRVVGVRPPVREARKLSRTGSMAVLATRAAVRSRALAGYIRDQGVARGGAAVHRIDCSELVELVESGDFVSKRVKTREAVARVLGRRLVKNGVDVATLSSTHLPFLDGYLQEQFPGVRFVDPARGVAKVVARGITPSSRGSLRIYATGSTRGFERSLARMGIKNRVSPA